MLPCQRAVPTTPADRNGCICPVSFPVSCCLPGYTGRSASASLLSRPAQASLTLRPTGSLSRPRRPLSQGSSPFGYPNKLPVSYSINRLLSRWNLPPLATRAQRGTLCKAALFARRAHAVYPRRKDRQRAHGRTQDWAVWRRRIGAPFAHPTAQSMRRSPGSMASGRSCMYTGPRWRQACPTRSP